MYWKGIAHVGEKLLYAAATSMADISLMPETAGEVPEHSLALLAGTEDRAG